MLFVQEMFLKYNVKLEPFLLVNGGKWLIKTVADPDIKLRGGGGGEVCFACPAGFPSFCDFFFFIQGDPPQYKRWLCVQI